MNDKIEAKFSLKQLAWKQGAFLWTMVLAIKAKLSEAFSHYEIKMVFDEKKFSDRIDQIEEDIDRVKKDRRLPLPGQKKEEIDSLKSEIEGIESEMKTVKKECPDIEFKAQICSVDWSKDAVIELLIDDELLGKINAAKRMIDNYKIIMTPVSAEESV